MQNYADLMFTKQVQLLQDQAGTREKYQTAYSHRTQSGLGDDEKAFIAASQSFYMASISADGWPYIQHCGGPRGFVKIIDDHTLACADYRGNRQFISMGNLSSNARISLFFMDYLNKSRLKIQGEATLTTLEASDPELAKSVQMQGHPAERVLTIKIIAMDWNCPKYIPDFYPREVVSHVLNEQLGALTQENEKLRAELAELKGG